MQRSAPVAPQLVQSGSWAVPQTPEAQVAPSQSVVSSSQEVPSARMGQTLQAVPSKRPMPQASEAQPPESTMRMSSTQTRSTPAE